MQGPKLSYTFIYFLGLGDEGALQSHILYLNHALDLAKRRRGFCAPNPAVGAILVKNGVVLAEGFHYAAGFPHAEIEALKHLPNDVENATLYVTLEPCCHFGKTPPCTQQIKQRRIKEVIFGYSDPNQQLPSQGERELQATGIACQRVEVPEINEFYASYSRWVHSKLPSVTAKIAISLDSKIAAENGLPVAITGSELQQYTHEWRKQSDAILTTVRTIINDDPSLNVRLQNETIAKPLYVLDRQLRLPLDAKVLSTTQSLTLFHEANLPVERVARYKNRGIKCVAVDAQGQQLNLSEIMKLIGQEGVHDLFVEAGGRCFSELLRQGLLQRGLIYIAAKILGENAVSAFSLSQCNLLKDAKSVKWQQKGEDVVCHVLWPVS